MNAANLTVENGKATQTKYMLLKTSLSPQQRLYSLDALRGFDMFWIMGAEEIFHKLYEATGSPFWGAISLQFTHPDWNGFHAYDLIFPLFLFMAGVATPYSVGRELEKGRTREQLLWRVIKRGLILVLLGIFNNNGLEIRPLSEIRFGSVLGRIGLAYMFANIIYLYSKERAQMIWFFGLLIGYWLLLKFMSAPGFPRGDDPMAFCSGCGGQIPEGATACPACGRAVGSAGAAVPASTGGMTDNVAGMLAYFTLIPAIIFLVMEPYNKKRFVRFHAFQCLFLHGVWVAIWIVLIVLSIIFGFVLPILAHLIGMLIWMVLVLGFFILWIVLVLKANQGQMFKLPIIGDLAEKQANAA